MPRSLHADPLRGNGDESGKDARERTAEQGECEDHHDGAGLPPDDSARGNAEQQAAPDDHVRRDRLGGQGEADPDGGQRAPVAEGGQPGGRRRQAQVTADVTGLPLARAHLQAGVHEEHRQPQRQDGDHSLSAPALGRLICLVGLVRRAGSRGRRARRGGDAPPVDEPAGGGHDVERGQDEISGPPGTSQDRDRDHQRPDRGADAVETVQQVQEPGPARERDDGVETAVHHSRGDAHQRADGEHEPQSRCRGVADSGHGSARAGDRQHGGRSQPADEAADGGRYGHRADGADQQDEAEVAHGRAETVAHRRPGGSEHPVRQAEDCERSQAHEFERPVRRGRPAGGSPHQSRQSRIFGRARARSARSAVSR
jgi:hypothetical protein